MANYNEWYSCRLAVIRRVALVEQELLTILVHLSSSLSYSEVRSAQSLVFCLVLVEQELLTILVHLSSPPSYGGVLAAQTLVFCLVLYLRFFVILSFSLDRCIVCLPSIYGLWLPLWYLQTFYTLSLRLYRIPLHSFVLIWPQIKT
jgi:hypothetical protein